MWKKQEMSAGLIRPVHTKVPGRGRYHAPGLCVSETLKNAIERGLSGSDAVVEFSVNRVTGNVLIWFNSDNDHQSIAVMLQEIVSEISSSPDDKPDSGESEPDEISGTQKHPVLDAGKAISGKVSGKVKSMLGGYAPQPEHSWHTMTCQDALSTLNTDPGAGLSHETAWERIQFYGPNALPEPESRSRWDILKGQFISLPVGLLGIAAGVSVLTGGLLDAAVIMGVVVANGVIGYFTESEAERTISSLKSFVKPIARIVRNGVLMEVPAEEIVPGDLVMFKPGYYIPADCRVLSASHLSIDESALTGESMPVFKTSEPLASDLMPLADRVNMVYMGTLVTGGEGFALAVATGQYTEFGKLQKLLGETTTPETPIEKQLGRIGDQLVLACIGVCGIVFIIGFFRGFGFLEMLRTSISLAAAAVPEGLPAAATINFALGINNLKQHHVLVRHLQAIETLGAVQTVCLDKTGTITYNSMSLVKIYAGGRDIDVRDGGCFLAEDPFDPLVFDEIRELMNVCALCSDVKIKESDDPDNVELIGSPTEKALIELALGSGIDVKALRREFPLVQVEDRAENRLYMMTLHESPDGDSFYIAVKGSPSDVLDMCDRRVIDGRLDVLTEEERVTIETQNERMAGNALRVLGVAYAKIDKNSKTKHDEDLIWLGLAGMVDPIREGAKSLIEAYHRAGVDTVMITGDQSPTAYSVAEQLHIYKGEQPVILDSTELIALRDDVMTALAKEVDVYSRVSPSHKLKIVQALQSAGRVVAMTGDGINDSPALKAADIGIAMGRTGTDVAREVADIVLQQDDLETLITAIRDGRTTYQNIRKSLRFFLSTNMSEIMIMAASMTAGAGSPLTVMQLLWINCISDIFPGLALSMEEAESDVLEQSPRLSDAPILDASDLKRMSFESAMITSGALGAYAYGALRYGPGARASSLAFQGLTLGQLFHAVACRSETTSIFDKVSRPKNTYFDIAVWGSIGLQVLTMVIPPLRNFLGVVRPGFADIGVIAASSLLPLLTNELTKKKPETKND